MHRQVAGRPFQTSMVGYVLMRHTRVTSDQSESAKDPIAEDCIAACSQDYDTLALHVNMQGNSHPASGINHQTQE